LEGKSQDIKILEGETRFQRGEKAAAGPENLLHIAPGRVNPFRPRVRPGIQNLIEDLETRMGHPDLIRVGKGQSDLHIDTTKILADRVDFISYVAGRPRNAADPFIHHD
jgi:hypothetical protein